MECRVTVDRPGKTPTAVLASCHTIRRIGIVLSNGFALPETAAIVEIFDIANNIAESLRYDAPRYDVCLLSASGGRIASSSFVFVWTDSIDKQHSEATLRSLFVVGGAGIGNAPRDERLVGWLRRVSGRGLPVHTIGDGQLLLEACLGQTTRPRDLCGRASGSFAGSRTGQLLAASASPLQAALSVVREDLGDDVARHVSNWVIPAAETTFTAIARRSASMLISEQIRTAARWIEANGERRILVDEAAQIAAMSERNFLRRFKLELGVTPSEYLTYVRLDMCCRLLVETNLPIDKIARRCGIGNGARLSRLFRQHLQTTPTDYRVSRRRAGIAG